VSEKRRRWILNIILILSCLSFFGIYLVPLLGTAFQPSQPASSPSVTAAATVSPTPTQISPEAKKADLEAQARGYELVLQREPENTTALQGLIETRLQLLSDFNEGDPKILVGPLEKLAKLKPEQTNYTVLLAQTREFLGDHEGAALAYRTVLNAKPGDPYALAGFANLYLKQNRPEAAISLLQETLKAAPQANQAQPGAINIVTIQVMLGEVYTKLKRSSEAIGAYDQAIKTDSQDFRPILGKARILKAEGKTKEAKPLLDSAFKLAPAEYKDAIKKEISQLVGMAAPASPAPAPSGLPSPTASSP
jgi:tetratricopeptide (TPR) repeat protein